MNSTISVEPFNDNSIVLIAIEEKNKLSYHILDLNSKSINWTMSDDFNYVYYNPSTNTAICVRAIRPADSIWGKMKFEEFEVNMYGEMHKIQ